MNRIFDPLKKKISNYCYHKDREAYLKSVVGNLGEIIEEEDKIICHVDQELLDKYGKKDSSLYDLRLQGMIPFPEETKRIIDYFKLNKPVYYIFENITFDEGLEFSSFHAHVVFKNCTFYDNVAMMFADDVTFENNKYFDKRPIYYWGKCFFFGKFINKLTFINDDFFNSYEDPYPWMKKSLPNFGMDVQVDVLEIIDTKIDCERSTSLNINANKAIIRNSKINAYELYLESKSIEFFDSSILAKNGVMIENQDCDFEGNVQSSVIVYNGVELSSQNNKIFSFKHDKTRLEQSRQLFIEQLRNLRNYCQKLNKGELQRIQDEFDEQPVSKILK